MKNRRILAVFLSLILLFSFTIAAYAHDRNGHDDDIEYVLFGDTEYKETHPIVSSKIQLIEDATYLCVDQFNGNGKEELARLQEEKIPGLPETIDEIDFTSNYTHRSETHRGWNLEYTKSNWTLRKQILHNTVEKELFSTNKSFFSWLPWKKGKDSNGVSYDAKCWAFCRLLYYTHVLGDHIEADKPTALNYVDPLTQLHDRDNPGVIPDLISCCDELFVDQKDSYTYKQFRQEMEALRDASDKLTSSKGGINTDEKFNEYHQCAEDLLDLMALYIPKLLKNESFFADSFGL